MKGTSKIIMGATLVMVVSLAMVLALVLVLLAELYCSLLRRRRQTTTAAPTTTNSSNQPQTHLPSLTNIYSHGVLQAPRTLLFPPPFDKHLADIEKTHHSQQTQHLKPVSTLNQPSLLLNPQSPSSISVQKTPVLSPVHSNKHMVGIQKTHHTPPDQTLNPTSLTNHSSLTLTPQSPSSIPLQKTPVQHVLSPKHFNKHTGIHKNHHSPLNLTSPINQSSILLTPPLSPSSITPQKPPFQTILSPAHFNKHLVGRQTHHSPPPQIFNPSPTLIQSSSKVPFECDSTRTSISDTESGDFVYISNPIYDNEAGQRSTPFETPDTSPSRLGVDGSSGEEGERPSSSSGSSPASVPVTPMKKLPAEACSVSLRDGGRCLGSSGSDCCSNYSNNGGSSSSSGSPCTSPSW